MVAAFEVGVKGRDRPFRDRCLRSVIPPLQEGCLSHLPGSDQGDNRECLLGLLDFGRYLTFYPQGKTFYSFNLNMPNHDFKIVKLRSAEMSGPALLTGVTALLVFRD